MVWVVGFQQQRRHRRALAVATAAAATLVLVGCQARPGDAPIAEDPTPTQTQPTTAPDRADRTITIGVSEFNAGFNPHLLTTDPTFATVVADLILPSAFREDVDGELKMDADLLESVDASETDAGAQKVRYVIRPDAQWSDGTPVSGNDFEYLWQSMRQNTGVRNAIGYEAIKDVHVSGGGRIVDVTFTNAFPNWRTLFNHLLPSHTYRTAGTAFTDVMHESIPVSGGRYTVESLDIGRNDLVLVRNDRFSGAHPAATEILKFREVTSDQHGAELLRTEQAQVVSVRPGTVTNTALRTVPKVTAQTTRPPAQLQLDFNVSSTELGSAKDRGIIAEKLDVSTLATIVAGRTAPPVPKPLPHTDAATQPAESTTQSSTEQSPTHNAPTRFSRPLRIAYPQGNSQAGVAAATISDQLNSQDIAAEAVAANRRDLYAGYLPAGTIDMTVTWQWQPDSVTSLVSQYLCPPRTRSAIEVEEPTSSEETETETSSEPSTTTAEDTTEPEETTTADTTFGRGSNTSGLCNPSVDKLLLGALRTETDSANLKKELAPLLADEVVTVPLLSDEWLTATTDGVVSGTEKDPKKWPQHAQTGLFVTAPQWKRTTDG